ncbi:MAG: ABC transporter substrate-binding protein, partial [Methyloprofundus sp.]|nr:ABC transporter substrate-binding protein [Methyloprofundus sp.]
MKILPLCAVFIMAVIIYWFVAYSHQQEIIPSGKVVKIGIIAPLGGVNKNQGILGVKGLEVAQQLRPYLNDGASIEWVSINDNNEPQQAVQALKILAEMPEIVAIVMFSGSDASLAVAKVAEQYRIPILMILASHPDISTYGSFVNQFNFDDTFQAAVAALYVRDELLIEKVAIVMQSGNSHFLYLANEFVRQFNSTEGLITDRYDLQINEQDYLQILQSIQHKDPELLYLPVDMQQLFKIQMALQKLDWHPEIMVSDGIFEDIKMQKADSLTMVDKVLFIDA